MSAGIPEAAVLGVEGPLWSETVRGGDQAMFLTLPRVVAAPGTKASADGTQIAADTVTSDGDPASKSELAEPLRATLRV